jgi:tetratricopeptide (TPR) repeat protein
MAKLTASDRGDRSRILSLFHGYASLGLRKEAGAYLERKIHLGELTREEATPLFEKIAVEQSRWEEPASLLAICEMALRSRIRTPWILYSYGTGLRSAGRLSDAKTILSQIKAGSALHPFALYAIGQIAEEEGNGKTALEIFRRVRLLAKDRPELGFLDRRVSRSQAELLLVTGRSVEAVPLFEAVLSQTQDPLVKIGLEAARKESPGKEGVLHAERIAGLPTRERVLLSLMLGGLSMERGDHDSAVAHMTRAEEDLQSSLLSGVPPASERLEKYKSKELLDRQVGLHTALRRELATPGKGGNPETIRDTMVELLLGNLFMDHVLSRSLGSMPAVSTFPPVPVSSSRQMEEVLQKIEQVTLGGLSVDGLVEEIAKKVEILQNIAHPLPRYRLLTKLAKSHDEILLIKERIRKRREDAIAGVQTGNASGSSQFFGDLGRFLAELDKTRKIAAEAREFMKRNFDVMKNPGKGKKESSGEIRGMVSEVLAFDNERFASLLPSIQALEERTRIASWERKRQEILVLRPVVLRHLADALVARAFSLREDKEPEWSARAPAILEKAGSYLSEEGIPLDDKAEIAANIGSFLIPGEGRWELHPGRKPGEADRKMIERILPWLEDGGGSDGNRERKHYVRALLKMSVGAPDAISTGRDFLAKYPSSPLVGDIAVRMGNDAILAGRLPEATVFYRMAANVDRPGPPSIARYMLGWVRYHDGDSEGAAGELVHPLSDPSFSCENPAPFEKSVLILAVRTWMDLPPERLDSFPPVKEGRCGGKLLLTSLGEAEEKRGETSRAAAVFDVLAGRFSGDEATLTYEMKSVEDLLRAGRDDEAFPRALRLKEKYGPGSAWAESQPPEVREKAQEKLAGMLEAISERKFEEGIRSGKRSTMADAATGMEQYFAVREQQSGESKSELRFKWAIASIKSGDRETGIGILKSLLTEQRSGPVGEKAAILYADMMIAGFERKEETAEDAEKAALLLLERFSSEKAVSLAYRAATDMLGAQEYARAARIAGALEADKNTPAPLLSKARLVQAEAYVFLKEPANARGKADQIFAVAKGKGVEPNDLERAKDLFLLSSLKEVEAKTAANDWIGAAKMLEDLIGRFPEAKETPTYVLRAVRSYREGGDPEGAMRMATLFLRKYPRREEGVEIAGIVARDLEDRKEYRKAADVYAQAAEQFPANSASGQFLFHAARLSQDHGDQKNARIRYSSYRDRYPAPRWMNAYAALSVGLLDWNEGKVKAGLRGIEKGLRQVDAGVEPDAPKEFFEVAGKAQIAIGEHWAEQFRRLKLTAPLEKNLAIKDRFFRRSLEAFEKAERKAPLEVALNASQLSGDLLVEFGKAVLASQRPKGMTEEERVIYEVALAGRARPFFERSLDWYVGAIDRLEAEQGPSDLAIPIRQRMEEAQRLLAGIPAPQGGE